MNTHIGLRERIAQATTETEVVELLLSGQTFNTASQRTKLSWKYTAHRRIKQLEKNAPTTSQQTEVDKKKPVLKDKKGSKKK